MKTEISTIPPKHSVLTQMIPVMLCFFAMGFVDLVGTASNYVQKDLGLTDAQANLFLSLVFFWFLIFSVPTGLLMNRIGRKNTVLLSLVVTLVSLIVPMFGEGFAVMLIAFSMLGIGNALMQTSLNPLVSNLIPPPRIWLRRLLSGNSSKPSHPSLPPSSPHGAPRRCCLRAIWAGVCSFRFMPWSASFRLRRSA